MRVIGYAPIFACTGAIINIARWMPICRRTHLEYSKRDGERFREWALSIGMQTYSVVEVFLTSPKVEQQGYKSCMALLKLPEKYSSKRLEAACERALFYTSRPNLKNIQTILNTTA